MLTSEQQKIYNVKVPKGGYGYYTLYHGIYDPENDIDERPVYAQTGDKFEPEGSSVVYKATRRNGKTTWAIDEDAQRQSESGEGGSGGGSSLPALTGKNGKVLGVTLDASDNEQIEWVTPSGGGAEKFVVTLTQENDTWTADKTVAEIVEAYDEDQIVVAKYPGDGVYVELPISLVGSLPGASGAMFAGLDCRDQGAVSIISVMCMNQGSGDVIQTEITHIPTSANAPLIVTLTAGSTEGQLVGDKTCGEVYAAFTAGRSCLIGIAASGQTIAITSAILSDNTYTFGGSIGGQEISTDDGYVNDYITVTVGG